MHSRIQSPGFRILLHGQIWELLAPVNGLLILFQKSQRYIKPKKRGGVYFGSLLLLCADTQPRYILFNVY